MYFRTATHSLETVLSRFLNFIPEILSALLIIIIGLVVASIVKTVFLRLLGLAQFEALTKKIGIGSNQEEISQTVIKFLAGLIYWLVLLVFLNSAFSILHIAAFTDIVNRIYLFIPNVIAALVLLVAGFVGANILSQIIKDIASITHTGFKNILAGFVQWIIIIFTVMAALEQLNIATSLINILFTGFVAAVSIGGGIALGIAFGLGGKDAAAKTLTSLGTAMTSIPKNSSSVTSQQSGNSVNKRN